MKKQEVDDLFDEILAEEKTQKKTKCSKNKPAGPSGAMMGPSGAMMGPSGAMMGPSGAMMGPAPKKCASKCKCKTKK